MQIGCRVLSNCIHDSKARSNWMPPRQTEVTGHALMRLDTHCNQKMGYSESHGLECLDLTSSAAIWIGSPPNNCSNVWDETTSTTTDEQFVYGEMLIHGPSAELKDVSNRDWALHRMTCCSSHRVGSQSSGQIHEPPLS